MLLETSTNITRHLPWHSYDAQHYAAAS